MTILLRLLLAFAPLLATVLVGWLLMDGHVNLGGGEKDIFLTVPLLLWSFVYLFSFLALWWRRRTPGRSVALAAAIATGVVVVVWLVLFAVTAWK